MLGWINRSYVYLAIFPPDLVNDNGLQSLDIGFWPFRNGISVIQS